MENKKVIENEINEDELGEVAGGDAGVMGELCYFEPEQPIKHRISYGAVYVKCKSTCSGCCCRGSVYCLNNWHLAEQDEKDSHIWYAMPKYLRNHTDPRKMISPLSIVV